jgi:uncharacterized membrane protein YraQ (UPF0718 family)
MNLGLLLLTAILAVLVVLALRRAQAPAPVVRRGLEQLIRLLPRMICALYAAGFVAQLIPGQTIAALLGKEAGLAALPIAAVVGAMLPAGPVVAFALAAVLARSGASTPALITFISAWSVFTAHRIMIYELPLIGGSFTRLRLLANLPGPLLAGLLAALIGLGVSVTPVLIALP